MFEQFTERARQSLVLAQDEARALRHDYIGTEHILLGLLRVEEGIAAGVLDSLGISVGGVRAQVARIVGSGDDITTGQIPFTPRAKKVLELSLREALGLGHGGVGTEHVLLGLLHEGEGIAVRILAVFVEPDAIRTEVVAVLSRDGPEARVERAWAGESGNFYTLHSQVGVGHLPMSRLKRMPRQVSDYGVSRSAVPMLVGWLLFAVSLGVGVLIGWLIWG